jgi:hypothetical protein
MCEVCYTEDTLDCAHVTHICASRYARIQVSLSFSLPLPLFVSIYENKGYPHLTIICAGSYARLRLHPPPTPPPLHPPKLSGRGVRVQRHIRNEAQVLRLR